MTDVRGLVGVDIGVFDDDLAARRRLRSRLILQHLAPIRAALKANVDVAVAGDLQRAHARNRAHLGHKLIRDGARRLLQLPRKLESHRNGQFTE
jgi:hypothetical protein